MKIIKHGTFSERGVPIECPRCGCIFELNKEEFINSLYPNPSNKNETGLKHFCPECKLLVIYPRPHVGFIKDTLENYEYQVWDQ